MKPAHGDAVVAAIFYTLDGDYELEYRLVRADGKYTELGRGTLASKDDVSKAVLSLERDQWRIGIDDVGVSVLATELAHLSRGSQTRWIGTVHGVWGA